MNIEKKLNCNLMVGNIYSMSRIVKQENINYFAEAVGSDGAQHIDPKYAIPKYGSTIAHGLFTIEQASEIMFSLFKKYWLKKGILRGTFIKLVRPGDVITTYLEIESIHKGKNDDLKSNSNHIDVSTSYKCVNQIGEIVAAGEASCEIDI